MSGRTRSLRQPSGEERSSCRILPRSNAAAQTPAAPPRQERRRERRLQRSGCTWTRPTGTICSSREASDLMRQGFKIIMIPDPEPDIPYIRVAVRYRTQIPATLALAGRTPWQSAKVWDSSEVYHYIYAALHVIAHNYKQKVLQPFSWQLTRRALGLSVV